MALADRRPLAVVPSHAAPAFNAASDDSGDLVVSDLNKPYFDSFDENEDDDEYVQNDPDGQGDQSDHGDHSDHDQSDHDQSDHDQSDQSDHSDQSDQSDPSGRNGQPENERTAQNPVPSNYRPAPSGNHNAEGSMLAKARSAEDSPGLSPTSRSISPDSLMNVGPKKSASSESSQNSVSSRGSTPPTGGNGFFPKMNMAVLGKKPKAASRAPIATGISTTIPVTGEKPKPEQEGDASLEDDVLFAIFLILYEKDAPGSGMTVKQICDVLVERHPDMAQLSSKTSNLVSAKLNAYVKRVEKGDSNLKYALSREWADASPKRMVYVYRGLLAKDFHVHVKNAMQSHKQRPSPLTFVSGQSSSSPADSFEAAKQSAMSKPRRQTMFDLGISARPAFSESHDASHLVVPYHSAPVAANLKASVDHEPATAADDHAKAAGRPSTDSDFDFDDLEVFDTDDDSGFPIDASQKNGKRSKSMSYLSLNKKAKYVTAAAAAPRAPKTPSSHSANAAAAAAALHAAALKAITASASGSVGGRSKARPQARSNWEHAVQSGFLVQEIDAPEDVSLSDLDKYFS